MGMSGEWQGIVLGLAGMEARDKSRLEAGGTKGALDTAIEEPGALSG